MAKTDDFEQQQQSEVEHVAEEVFTSEKREDIWAIVIVAGVFLFCVAFPAQVHHFFTQVLFLF